MTEYIVLIPANETAWATKDQADRDLVYGKHQDFAAALAERGHKVTSGAELTPVAESRVVRQGTGGLEITDGPYAESAEQLSGFYVVESSDLDDLLQCVGILADAESGIEVRPCVDHSGGM